MTRSLQVLATVGICEAVVPRLQSVILMHVRPIGIAIALAALAIGDLAWAQGTNRMVAVNGHQLHVRIVDPQSPRPNGPTLVFESGLGDSGNVWDRVIGVLPKDCTDRHLRPARSRHIGRRSRPADAAPHGITAA